MQSFTSLTEVQPVFDGGPELRCFGEHNPTENTIAEVLSQQEQTKAIPDNLSLIWDTELENGILPSDSSSFAWGTTVVMDTGRNWNDNGGEQQSLRSVTDSRGQSRSTTTRCSDETSPSSLRVVSRFFSNYVSSLSLCEGESALRTPAVGWGDELDGEPQVLALGGLVDHPCLDVEWGRSSPSREGHSFLGDGYGAPLSGTLRVIFGVAGLTSAAKFIKKGGTICRALKFHPLNQSTPRTTAHLETYHWGSVTRHCQIWMRPNGFVTFQKGGDCSSGCKVLLCAVLLVAAN